MTIEPSLSTKDVTVVTGASGWVGRACLEELVRKKYSKPTNLKAFASRQKDIELEGTLSIPAQAESEIRTIQDEVHLFIPLSFLSQDLATKMSKEEYIEENRVLIDRSVKFVRDKSPKSIILMSSGVTEMEEEELPESYQIYRSLKLEQEEKLYEAAQDRGSNLAVCRLYSISGRYMVQPQKYAFGSFISNALLGKPIEIRARELVYRRYCDVSALVSLLFKIVETEKFTLFSSTGELVEMRDLALRVLTLVGDKNEVKIKDNLESMKSSGMHNYYSTGNTMDELALAFGIRFPSLDEQITITSKFLQSMASAW